MTVTDPYGTATTDELPDTAYSDCEGPVWAGTVGGLDLTVTLERDEYGECIIGLTAGSEDGEWLPVTLCKEIAATWVLYDGTEVTVACKWCDCVAGDGCPCCPGWPLERSANIFFTSIESGTNDCVPIVAEQYYSDTFTCTGTALNYPIFQNVGNFLYVRVVCDPDTLAWTVQYKSLATGMIANDPDTGTWVTVSYDFTCPDCANAIGGIAYGSFDFIGVHGCETSGGLVSFNVLVHADVEVQCV